MITLSRTVGLLLMVLGIASYVMTDMVSPTALIPTAFGFVISMLAFYGRDDRRRKIAMHLAMGIALAGIFGTMRGLVALPGYLAGGTVERPAAVVSQGIMAIVLILYLALGIRSFIKARG